MKFPQLKEEDQKRLVDALGARLKLIEAIQQQLAPLSPPVSVFINSSLLMQYTDTAPSAPPYDPPPYSP